MIRLDNKVSKFRIALLLCVVACGGCAHVAMPHALQSAAETQPTSKNPVIIAMPPVPSGDATVIIHEPGVDVSTGNIWLGALFVVLLLLAK